MMKMKTEELKEILGVGAGLMLFSQGLWFFGYHDEINKENLIPIMAFLLNFAHLWTCQFRDRGFIQLFNWNDINGRVVSGVVSFLLCAGWIIGVNTFAEWCDPYTQFLLSFGAITGIYSAFRIVTNLAVAGLFLVISGGYLLFY